MRTFDALNALKRSDLSAHERWILLLVIDHGTCWASVDTLAAEAGLSGRTVQRVLHRLVADGLLLSESRGQSTTIYKSTGRCSRGGDTVSPGGVTPCHPGGDTVSPDPPKEPPKGNRLSFGQTSARGKNNKQQHPGEDMNDETKDHQIGIVNGVKESSIDQLLLASLAARQFEWEPEDQFGARERVAKSLERFLRYNPEWTTEALAAWWDHAIEKLNLRIRAWNVILGPRWAEARDAFLAEWSNPRPQYRDLSARKAAK